MHTRSIARYGWIPDVPDIRDYRLAPPRLTSLLNKRVDLRWACAPVYNQLQSGSCTGNAWGAAFQFDQQKQYGKCFRPSRLQIYYDERVAEGSEGYDSGAQIRDGAKVLAEIGTCPEWMWPYDESKLTVKPGPECYVEAKKHNAISYWRVPQTRDAIRGCLTDGYPVVFGFTVYPSFESDAVAYSGIMPMPTKGDLQQGPVGGHAVMAAGYDSDKDYVIVRNSWGPTWGDKGYFYMPFAYMIETDLTDDLWTLRRVE